MSTLVDLNTFSLSVGVTQLLDSVDARLVVGQRIALVGGNGAGKSTLLHALAATNADSDVNEYFVVSAGEVKRGAHLSENGILMVEQDSRRWSRLLGGDEDELLEYPIADALDLCDSEDAAELSDMWRQLSISAHGALGWRTAGYERTPLGKLSPGCAARAYIALALSSVDVDVLLLDEPTNHLDLPSILWLERALHETGKTAIIVSHDCAFLDSVCDHVWAIDSDSKTIKVSGTSYTEFRRAQELARKQQMLAYEAQQKRSKKLTAVADKLRAASTAGMMSQMKDRDKLQRDFRRDRAGRSGKKAKAIETFRDSQETVERVIIHTPLKIDIEPPDAGGDAIVMFSDTVLGYDGVGLPLPPIDLRVDFGERVAIIGHNGIGKSTLLHTMMGKLPPVRGSVSVGRELRIGNLSQEHESLPRDRSLRQHYSELFDMTELRTVSRLMRYGLSRQQVDSAISDLNPGARARALLGGFSIRGVNALVLDEPTNHLDEEAISEVLGTCNNFEGTVIIVSHNREFLNALENTRVLCLDGNGLAEVENVDEFIEMIEENVAKVVDEWLR